MTQTPEELGKKIREAQERQRQSARTEEPQGDSKKKGEAAKAFRAATDLVAALVVGGFLGYWLDEWLGWRPWGMIFFIFIGFAAGFLNIYRSQTGQDYKVGFRDDTNAAPADETKKEE